MFYGGNQIWNLVPVKGLRRKKVTHSDFNGWRFIANFSRRPLSTIPSGLPSQIISNLAARNRRQRTSAGCHIVIFFFYFISNFLLPNTTNNVDLPDFPGPAA